MTNETYKPVVVGAGGNGVLYLINMDDKQYVCKTLKHNRCSWTEIYIMQYLNHPNINQGFTKFYPNEICIYEIPAIGDLRTLRKKGEELKIDWFYQIVKGVLFLHEHGFIHCDIKSSNILLFNEDNVVKVNDFGHTIKYGWERSKFLGTPNLRAPEMDTYIWGPQVDVWGLGTILYEISTGKELFKTKEDKKKFCDNYSTFFNDAICHPLCKRLLHPDPNERMTLEDLASYFSIEYKPYIETSFIFEPKDKILVKSIDKDEIAKLTIKLWRAHDKNKLDKSEKAKRRKLCKKVAFFLVNRKSDMNTQELQDQAYMMYEILPEISL